jgi:hypothetical protein
MTVDTFTVVNGSFKAEINLQSLGLFSLNKLRKLFRLTARKHLGAEWDNEKTIEYLNRKLPELVAEAKAAWEKASCNYSFGWRLVPKLQILRVPRLNPALLAKKNKTAKEKAQLEAARERIADIKKQNADNRKIVSDIKKTNNQLTSAVKQTKATYERWLKIHNIYKGELN